MIIGVGSLQRRFWKVDHSGGVKRTGFTSEGRPGPLQWPCDAPLVALGFFSFVCKYNIAAVSSLCDRRAVAGWTSGGELRRVQNAPIEDVEDCCKDDCQGGDNEEDDDDESAGGHS